MATREDVLKELARRELERRKAAEAEEPGLPSNVAELTRGVISRPTLAGIGGIGGGAVGAGLGLATGPGAPAVSPTLGVLGGGLGTAAGSLTYDVLNNTAALLGLVEESATIEEGLRTAAVETAFDVGFAGAASVFRPRLIGRAILGKLFGVTGPEVRRMTRAAELQGLGLGASDVGGAIPKGIVETIGVFPLTGTPAKRNLLAKEAAVSRRLGETLDLLAPNAILRNQAGINVSKAASKRFGKFRKVSQALYGRLEQAIGKAVDADGNALAIVPTQNVKGAAQDFGDALSRGEITLLSGDQLSSPLRDRVAEFALALQDLPANLTLDQHKRLVRDFRNLMDEVQGQLGKGQSFREASIMKEALEADFRALDLSQVGQDVADEIITAQRAADRFYSKTLARFETVTGKKFGRVDKNVFGPGFFKAGTLNQDELVDVVFSLRSPQALAELEAIVGPKTLRDTGRYFLGRAVDNATAQVNVGGQIVDQLDPQRLIRELGLEGRKPTQEGLDFLLRKAGVNVSDFKTVLETAARLEPVRDPSTFIRRRVTLGGARALTGAAGLGAAIGVGAGTGTATAGATTILALTLLSRKLTDIATNPVALKGMQTALDEAASTAARRQGLARALIAVGRSTQQTRERPEDIDELGPITGS